MGTMNRKILTRNLPVHLDDTELEDICSGISSSKRTSTPGDDLIQKVGACNVPDIVSSTSETSQSQDSMEDYKDPDIVRSNSSSDEKSLEMHIANRKAVRIAKVSDAGQSSVSSFSSSDGSKQSSSSSQDPDTKGKRSTAGSLDNDLQQRKASTAREGSWPDFFYNQDSVFAQESDDVPDGTVCYRPRQQAFISRQIPSPIIESDPSLTSKEQDSNYSSRCSEKGQQARNRFSSSGYGTGSGEGSQGASASKTSTQLSQGSFSKGDAAMQRSVGSSTVGSDGLESAETILHSKAASSNSTISNLHVNVTQSDSLKPAFQNASADRKVTADASLSSKGMGTNHGLRHSSSAVIDDPSVSLESEHKHKNQQAHTINPHQVERQSSVGLQRQPQLNPPLQSLTQSQVDVVLPGVKHIQATTLPQNIEQFPAGFDSERQLQLQINNGVIQTPQTGTTGTSLMSLRQQAALVSNGKLNASYDYQSLMRQHQPPSSGSLNYNTTPMSASSSGSCFVPVSVEEGWTAERSHASLAKLLLQSGSVASESSVESRYHLDSLLKGGDQLIQKHVHPPGASHFPQRLSENSDSSVLAELFSNESSRNDVLPEGNLWKKLEESVRCNETKCSDIECAQIKAVIADLENERYGLQSLSSSLENLLLAMFNHMAYVCDHPKCPFAWCGERIDNHHLSRDERLFIMKQRMENFAEHCTLLKSPVKYMKLKPSFPYNSMPEEDRHWMRLCMMGSSRRTLLVKPLWSYSCGPLSDTEYWVIKKVYLTDEGDNWSLYSRLREVKHRSVVSLLWAASFEDHILLCSMYEGFSLNDYLPSLPRSQSRFIPVFCIIQQLISAVRHVNSLGIVYLNWTSKNILVTYHSEMYFLIKLSNFSCSVLLDPPDGRQPCYDSGYLQLSLPWQVVTPELKDDNKVEYVSDVWGIGCLLHELVTGYPIWHEHRHLHTVESLVGKQPQVPNTCPELLKMFSACWQLDPSKRVPMNDLEIMLIQAFSHHLGS